MGALIQEGSSSGEGIVFFAKIAAGRWYVSPIHFWKRSYDNPAHFWKE
jgi:hypothetical protein